MILIISADNDTMTDAICTWLSRQEKHFVRLNENQIIEAVSFDFRNSVFEITIDHLKYDLKNFKSVFYRNGSLVYGGFTGEIDAQLLPFFNAELHSVTHFIYYFLEKSGAKVYGNLMTKEVNKLEVLHLAQELDFKIPDTYIFSQTRDIIQLNPSQKYITKSISEMAQILHDGELYLNYTREIDPAEISSEYGNILPTLIQEKVEKDYEIRAFFFEKKIWAVATFEFTEEIDTRNTNHSDKKHLPVQLPGALKKKIKTLAKRLNINCGTLDLLKSGSDYYFLEVNPLGQFHSVSLYGNYQIEKYIADLL
ncbi:MAG: hypothetical protein LBE92_17865 [Chryseobacterium sp.]|jgi:glutathione synthase/RimK-type ligase-like ATP-grasp enzyme|uniref:hypothetical protein n=1 Tax=Chryseobacterium sp. TaxID=1871047 RepID=UPI002823301B|nr:hypothetical protein [Chryseobacterium sp.]MDR2237993.1 hypothetical protein [Chryseobacterium sp.]